MSVSLAALLSTAYAYDSVNGISFPDVSEVETYDFYHDIHLTFQLHRQASTAYPDPLIYGALYFASLYSWKRIEPMGAIDHLCKRNNTLDIYEVSLEQLNDSHRFPLDSLPNAGTQAGPVWGYFEPREMRGGNDVIVLTPHDEATSKTVMYHEVAHYWYSAFCLERYTSMTSEEFAVAVEKMAEP